MRPRLFIFDAGLRDKKGHNFSLDLGVTFEASRRGFDSQVFGYKFCSDQEVLYALHPEPLFELSVYDIVDVSEDTLKNLSAANDKYYEALCSLDLARFSSNDIFFFHTIHSPNLLGLAKWLHKIAPQIQPRVIVYILYADYIDEQRGHRTHRVGIYKHFFRSILAIPNLRLRVLAETRMVQLDLQEFAQHKVRVEIGPFPANYQKLLNRPIRPRTLGSNGCRVGYLGQSRLRKGILLLPDIISYTCAKRNAVQFTVQVSVTGVAKSEINGFLRPFLENSRVTCIVDQLSDDGFYNCLASCDIILLPYSRGYNRQGSGILAESIAMGKVLVMPDYCGFREHVDGLGIGCVYFSDWDAECISEALVRAIDELELLAENAATASAKFISLHGPKPFFDMLFTPDSVGACSGTT
jgi:glycosyltransferase involved in cell wall biosynthesis